MAREKCTWCGKTLLPIADARKGYFGYKKDWNYRQMHKKCWNERRKKLNLTMDRATTIRLLKKY